MRRFNARIYSNRIKRIEERMVANQYSENLENDDLFFFNKNNCIGEGSDKNHTHIMMSSKAMMLKVENNGVLHIDGTYKLIKNRFPVIGNDIII